MPLSLLTPALVPHRPSHPGESPTRLLSAWGFELDHVAENIRKEDEASTKTGSVSNIKPLKGVLLEMTQCQLTCNVCHLNLTQKKTKEIAKMVF
jgi:hypothetical protein